MDTQWELKVNDIKTICRICMEKYNVMNNINQNENIYEMSIMELVNNYLCLKLEEDEQGDISSLICAQCEAEVFQFVEFKLKLEKSNKYFEEYLIELEKVNNEKNDEAETIQDPKEESVIIEYSTDTLDDVGMMVDVEFNENETEFEIQNEEIKEEKPHTCQKCHEGFDSKIKLRDHRRKYLHYTRKTVTCSKCKLQVPLQNYKSHFLKHSLKFHCELCNKIFSNNFNLKRHLYIHTNQTPYACCLCNAKFARQDKLKTHMIVHTNDKPFSCEICSEQFRRKDKLKNHQERFCCGLNHDEKYKRTLSCDICSKSFTLPSSLRTHKLLHTDNRVICNICGKPYPNEKKLQEHKLLVHRDKGQHEKEFLCNYCAKQYSSKALLKRHILSHLGMSKTYDCKVCNKTFTQSGSLALHLKIHTGEKPFVCHVCSKAFNKPSNLQRHLRSHDNIRPYVCAICGKGFSVKHSLVVHTRVHTGEKPYECTVCGKTFVDRGSLNKHMRIHSGQH